MKNKQKGLTLTIAQIKELDSELNAKLKDIKVGVRTAYHLGRLHDALQSVVKRTAKLEKEIFDRLATDGEKEYAGQRVVIGENLKDFQKQLTELNEMTEQVPCAQFKIDDLEYLDENKRPVSTLSPVALNLLNDVLEV